MSECILDIWIITFKKFLILYIIIKIFSYIVFFIIMILYFYIIIYGMNGDWGLGVWGWGVGGWGMGFGVWAPPPNPQPPTPNPQSPIPNPHFENINIIIQSKKFKILINARRNIRSSSIK